jgi:hypothetical protein
MLDDRQMRIVEHPRAASARLMREVAVQLEVMADAADASWFELPELHRAPMRELALKVRESTRFRALGPIGLIKSLPGALAWIRHADDVMTFASALQRFERTVTRKINEEKDGAAAAWLEISSDSTFMAALKRGDAEIKDGSVVHVDCAELQRRSS